MIKYCVQLISNNEYKNTMVVYLSRKNVYTEFNQETIDCD